MSYDFAQSFAWWSYAPTLNFNLQKGPHQIQNHLQLIEILELRNLEFPKPRNLELLKPRNFLFLLGLLQIIKDLCLVTLLVSQENLILHFVQNLKTLLLLLLKKIRDFLPRSLVNLILLGFLLLDFILNFQVLKDLSASLLTFKVYLELDP